MISHWIDGTAPATAARGVDHARVALAIAVARLRDAQEVDWTSDQADAYRSELYRMLTRAHELEGQLAHALATVRGWAASQVAA